MSPVRQPPVAGSVEFADGTTDTRSRTAAGPLGRATLATLHAPPVLPGRPWRWRLHHNTAELWLTPTHPEPQADRPEPEPGGGLGDQPRPPGRPADADRRRRLITGGIALHQALVALAGTGHTAEVRRLPDPHCPDLLAELTTGASTPVTVAAAHAYRTMLLGTAPTAGAPVPRQRRTTPGPADLLPCLQDAATASGAGLRPLPTDPHLTQPPTTTRTGTSTSTSTSTSRLDPTATYAVLHVGADVAGTPDPDCRYAVVFATADTDAGWLAAGEALGAVVVTATALGPVPVTAGTLLDSRATRDALAPLLPAGSVPIVVLRIGGTSRSPSRDRRLPPGDFTRRSGGPGGRGGSAGAGGSVGGGARPPGVRGGSAGDGVVRVTGGWV